MMRRIRLLRWAGFALASIAARAAVACGAQMPAIQVAVPSVVDLSRTDGLGIGAITPTWWQFSWFDTSDASNVAFTARIIDFSGPGLAITNREWTTVVQPAPSELDVQANWYPTEAGLGGAFDLHSVSSRVALRLVASETLRVYPIGRLDASPYLDFAISTEPVPPTLPDLFEDVFCSGFDEKK